MPVGLRVVSSNLKLSKILKHSPQVIEDALFAAGEQWTDDSADMLLESGHVVTGRLRNDLDYVVTGLEEGFALDAIVPATNHYGEVIHENRDHPAKWPPRQAIEKWVERKLGISRDDKKFSNIVFCIRRNIGLHGMTSIPAGGLQFFWKPLRQNLKRYLKSIQQVINEGLRRVAK